MKVKSKLEALVKLNNQEVVQLMAEKQDWLVEKKFAIEADFKKLSYFHLISAELVINDLIKLTVELGSALAERRRYYEGDEDGYDRKLIKEESKLLKQAERFLPKMKPRTPRPWFKILEAKTGKALYIGKDENAAKEIMTGPKDMYTRFDAPTEDGPWYWHEL